MKQPSTACCPPPADEPDLRPVQPAGGGVVDVLDAGRAQLEPGLLEGAVQPLVLLGQELGVDEEREALVEAQLYQVGIALLRQPG